MATIVVHQEGNKAVLPGGIYITIPKGKTIHQTLKHTAEWIIPTGYGGYAIPSGLAPEIALTLLDKETEQQAETRLNNLLKFIKEQLAFMP